jgi:hypothetical protein
MPNIIDYDIQAVEDEYQGYLERQAEYQAELDLENYLIQVWEAMQPVDDEPLDNSEIEPF